MHESPFIPREKEEQARVREERERSATRACEHVWLEGTCRFTQKVTTVIGGGLCGFMAGMGRQVCAGLAPHFCTSSEQLSTVGAQPGWH